MNSPQTSTRIAGLSQPKDSRRHHHPDWFQNPRGCGEAHSLPCSSSVADPAHAPIDRGQRHGSRERVWKTVRKEGGYGDVDGGSYRIGGIGTRGGRINFKKGRMRCFGFLESSEILTQDANFRKRSLDG